MTTFEFTQGDIVKWLKANQWQAQNGYMDKYHAVLCDPPYALISINKRFGGQNAAPAKYGKDGLFQRQSRGFMNQKWDGWDSLEDYQAWVTEWASLLLDFVHPGAVGAFFGGTRTWHRLACGLEDAGWEVWDTMMYLYGSGFPKSLDVGKQLDKEAGAAREVVGVSPDSANRIMTTFQESVYKSGWSQNPEGERLITAPATPAAKQFDGWHSPALKPMWESIVLCRAPRQGHTYAQLAQRFGSGAINVDGARIAGDKPLLINTDGKEGLFGLGSRLAAGTTSEGRFPGNVALLHSEDCTAGGCAEGCVVKELDATTDETKSTGGGMKDFSKSDLFMGETAPNMTNSSGYGDVGGVSRFFYTAKAGGLERFYFQDGEWKRVTHPTLKPINLIEWLATLLLPPKLDTPRRLLVPFSGVASEMIGAHLAGWDVVHGIEQSAAYIAEGKQRAAWWGQFSSYDKAAESYASAQAGAREDTALEAAGQLPLFKVI